MPQTSVEELTLSLVREFLSRKGLKATLASMDAEQPRSEDSISNRVALAKAVHIEKLMKRNKEQTRPYRTMMEVIVKWLLTSSSTSLSTQDNSSSDLKHSNLKKEHSLVSNHTQASTSQSSPCVHADPPPLHNSLASTTTGTNSDKSSPEHHTLATHGKPITSSQATKIPSSSEAHPTTSSTLGGNTRIISTSLTTDQDVDSLTLKEGATSSRRTSLKESRRSQSMGVRSKDGGSFLQAGHKSMTKKFKPRSLSEFDEDILDDKGGRSRHATEPLLRTSQSGSASITDSKTADTVKGSCMTEGTGKGSLFGDFEEMAIGQTERSKVMRPAGSTGHPGTVMSGLKDSSISAGLLLCEDLEDVEFGGQLSHDPPLSNRMTVFPTGKPITMETARALRQLLFGTSKGPSFTAEWRKQNFLFCDLPGLEYGLVQHKGGPCGVLAAVQAYLLKHLMFTGSQKQLTGSPHPSPEERKAGLVSALRDILWKAGAGKRATVALLSSSGMSSLNTTFNYQPDRITERLIQHDFTDRNLMESFLTTKLPLLQDDGSSGCIQFLMSVLITKGVDNIRSEMDEKNGRLIGAHGYCTQDMVNLLLTGVASSNVFDGEMNLGSSDKDKLLLRGIKDQSEIGLLSLFEHYGSCTVGSHYKEPVYPIWVVCSESHFSVLFSHQLMLLKDWRLERRFDLHYYDGLANQDEAIRLTIDSTSDKSVDGSSSDVNLTPPLDSCIRTKWVSAVVDWNGTDPLL